MGRHNSINCKEKRIILFSFMVLLIFTLLSTRLFFLQLFKHEEFLSAAEKQRIREVRVYPSRGIIYDRNLIPLTNRVKVSTAFVFKEFIQEEGVKSIVKNISGLNDQEINEIALGKDGILEFPVTNESYADTNINGILLTDKTLRYDKSGVLSHVIGYVKKSNNEGMAGIEKTYDDILKMGKDNGVFSFSVDGKKRVIPGLGYTHVTKDNSKLTNSVKLTIDYHIQKLTEEIMDKDKRKGTAIVAEVKSGDIVAMVSRPNINQEDIGLYINNVDMELYNRAIQVSYPPGSIFKIVVLIAALENGIVDLEDKFLCNGYETIGDLVIGCHNKEGHGEIDVQEAFYDSCNSIFIQIGKLVGAEKIIDTARRLGFEKKVEIGLLEEVQGNLPKGNELLGPAIGNISIGQGSIEVTPIQVTNLMMILANDGIKKDMTIVDSIVTEAGETVRKVIQEKDVRVLSLEISHTMKQAMEKVISSGTASNIMLNDIGGGAGKTGSAEAVLNKKETIHGWFSGYYPKDNPRYVITVLIEEGQSGGKSAGPIFEKIARQIEIIGR